MLLQEEALNNEIAVLSLLVLVLASELMLLSACVLLALALALALALLLMPVAVSNPNATDDGTALITIAFFINRTDVVTTVANGCL